MTPTDFSREHLPQPWGERDLQLLIQRRISKSGLIQCSDEVRIKTKSTTRRSDLETWFTRYELKRELTYDSLKSALGQLYLYDHYGSKLLWIFPKRKCIIGLSPFDYAQQESAARLAADIRGMGIEVIFLDQQPNWRASRFTSWQIKASILTIAAAIAFGVSLVIASF